MQVIVTILPVIPLIIVVPPVSGGIRLLQGRVLIILKAQLRFSRKNTLMIITRSILTITRMPLTITRSILMTKHMLMIKKEIICRAERCGARSCRAEVLPSKVLQVQRGRSSRRTRSATGSLPFQVATSTSKVLQVPRGRSNRRTPSQVATSIFAQQTREGPSKRLPRK
jgi:hypothetical protein